MNYIIPTLNRPTLHKTVSSILSEDTNSNIIVNSSAESAGGNRNIALKRIDDSMGWILFIDDDDYYSSGYLSELDDECDIVVFRMMQYGRIIPRYGNDDLVGGNVGINFAMKVDFYRKLNLLFDEGRHREDWRFLEQYLKLNPKTKITEDIYYNTQ